MIFSNLMAFSKDSTKLISPCQELLSLYQKYEYKYLAINKDLLKNAILKGNIEPNYLEHIKHLNIDSLTYIIILHFDLNENSKNYKLGESVCKYLNLDTTKFYCGIFYYKNNNLILGTWYSDYGFNVAYYDTYETKISKSKNEWEVDGFTRTPSDLYFQINSYPDIDYWCLRNDKIFVIDILFEITDHGQVEDFLKETNNGELYIRSSNKEKHWWQFWKWL